MREFYANTGISRGTLESKTGITEDTLAKFIAKYPEVNIEWLLLGKGDMLNPGGGNPISRAVKVEPGAFSIGIPLVSSEAAAGFGSVNFAISDQDIQSLYQVPDFANIDFMIRVKGNSMYPKYSSGDIIACRVLRDSKFIEWNKPHLISTAEHGLLVKRIRKSKSENSITAVSDNKEYDAFEIPMNEVTGIAIIIGVIRLE